MGPTSSSIVDKLKLIEVSIPKYSKVANYASVPLVMEVELWVITYLELCFCKLKKYV
ncbi:hypothetical protein [Clostridium senegalense]|uniref:hypothetical protein n=1 Tax=Clostridium senegalense TaxID=1465809 RepID=UPI001F47760A|nr:hypothetical protein [Clostridium senegalense]